MELHREFNASQTRKAVSRSLPEPPSTRNQDWGVEQGGGADPRRGAQSAGHEVGRARQALDRTTGERHQESLARDASMQVGQGEVGTVEAHRVAKVSDDAAPATESVGGGGNGGSGRESSRGEAGWRGEERAGEEDVED